MRSSFLSGWLSSKLGLHCLSGSPGIGSGGKVAFSPRSPMGQRFSSRWPTPGVLSRTSDARPAQEELGCLVGCRKRRFLLCVWHLVIAIWPFDVVTGVSRDVWVHVLIQTLSRISKHWCVDFSWIVDVEWTGHLQFQKKWLVCFPLPQQHSKTVWGLCRPNVLLAAKVPCLD